MNKAELLLNTSCAKKFKDLSQLFMEKRLSNTDPLISTEVPCSGLTPDGMIRICFAVW